MIITWFISMPSVLEWMQCNHCMAIPFLLSFCMSYIIVIIIIIISIMCDPSGRQRSVLNVVSLFFFFVFSFCFFLFLLNSYSSNGCVKYEHLH